MKGNFGAATGLSSRLYTDPNLKWRELDAIHLLMGHRYYSMLTPPWFLRHDLRNYVYSLSLTVDPHYNETENFDENNIRNYNYGAFGEMAREIMDFEWNICHKKKTWRIINWQIDVNRLNELYNIIEQAKAIDMQYRKLSKYTLRNSENCKLLLLSGHRRRLCVVREWDDARIEKFKAHLFSWTQGRPIAASSFKFHCSAKRVGWIGWIFHIFCIPCKLRSFYKHHRYDCTVLYSRIYPSGFHQWTFCVGARRGDHSVVIYYLHCS